MAVPTNGLAEIPASVTFAQAATLPTAGLTALRALEKGGLLLNRRVLITGSTGGVGLFAHQLARLSGASVVGLVRSAHNEMLVREAGADEVIVGDDLEPARAYGPYHLIIESLGGKTLASALSLLATRGTCVTLARRLPDGVVISATDVAPFGTKHFAIPFDATGKSWVRFAVWDTAGNGAFVQPVWLHAPKTTSQ